MKNNELMTQLDIGSLENRVWHYTSLEGLLSILKTDELWASSPSSVNDSSEMRFAMDVFFSYWEDLKPNHPNDRDFINEVVKREIFEDFLHSVFFVSASKNSDLLNMWMHYSKSQGFAIELDANIKLQHSALDPLVTDLDERIGLVFPDWYDVAYGEDPLISNYLAVIKWLTRLRTTTQFNSDLERIEFGRVALLSKFLKTKHLGFAVEDEVRFVTATQDKSLIRYRNRGGNLVPYIPLRAMESSGGVQEFFKLPILGVICAPGVSDEMVDNVRGLLNFYGYDEVNVTKSQIPYVY